MTTMNISLPDSMKAFIDEQVAQRGYGTSSEYVRELIRREQDRAQMRSTLLAAGASPIVAEATPDYFAKLRTRVRKSAAAAAPTTRLPAAKVSAKASANKSAAKKSPAKKSPASK